MKKTNMKVTLLSGCPDSKDTHKTKWFQSVWADVKEIEPGPEIADPFARDCRLAKYTNDLDPNTQATNHLEALDFLSSFDRDSLDLVIFDPPFSERQTHDKYDGFGINLYASNGVLMSDCHKAADLSIKPGGHLLKFGYNCNTWSHNFDLVALWIVQKTHKNHNNSTIVSLWQNKQYRLS